MEFWRVLAAVASLAVVGGCGEAAGDRGAEGSGVADAAAHRPLSEVDLTYQDQYGLDLWGRFSPHRDGRVMSATLVAAGRSAPAFVFLPNFDTDEWPPPTHPRLSAGRSMRIHSHVLPACDDLPHGPPVVTVAWRRSNGHVVRSALAVVMTGKTSAETRAWVDSMTQRFCSRPQQVRVQQSRMSASPDGRSTTVTYTLRNPGPGEVTVTSEAWRSSGDARWLPAAGVVVPADGQPRQLTVRGVDGICASSDVDTPYGLGLLSYEDADGERHILVGDDDGLENVCP